jgi:hypothetical protein
MSNEVQNNICRSQTIERLSDRLLVLILVDEVVFQRQPMPEQLQPVLAFLTITQVSNQVTMRLTARS